METVYKNFVILTGKHLCYNLFNKVAGMKACSVTDKRLQHRCLPWILRNFQDTYFEDYLQTTASESKTEFVQGM